MLYIRGIPGILTPSTEAYYFLYSLLNYIQSFDLSEWTKVSVFLRHQCFSRLYQELLDDSVFNPYYHFCCVKWGVHLCPSCLYESPPFCSICSLSMTRNTNSQEQTLYYLPRPEMAIPSPKEKYNRMTPIYIQKNGHHHHLAMGSKQKKTLFISTETSKENHYCSWNPSDPQQSNCIHQCQCGQQHSFSSSILNEIPPSHSSFLASMYSTTKRKCFKTCYCQSGFYYESFHSKEVNSPTVSLQSPTGEKSSSSSDSSENEFILTSQTAERIRKEQIQRFHASDRLSTDMLFNIMQFLEPIDIVHCTETSKSWNKMINSSYIWKVLYKRYKSLICLHHDNYKHNYKKLFMGFYKRIKNRKFKYLVCDYCGCNFVTTMAASMMRHNTTHHQ